MKVPSSSDETAVRTALQSADKTTRKAAVAACRQYAGNLVGGGKSNKGSKGNKG
jgi:hypothetical protein